MQRQFQKWAGNGSRLPVDGQEWSGGGPIWPRKCQEISEKGLG